jgi:hypothetical protein
MFLAMMIVMTMASVVGASVTMSLVTSARRSTLGFLASAIAFSFYGPFLPWGAEQAWDQ